MPLPKPNDGEQKDDWMHRCMGNDTIKKDFEDQKQRIAVCLKQWRDKHPEDKPPADALAAVSVNGAAESQARRLIKAGKVDMNSAWSISADDENKMLGDNQWAEYSRWFLGKDPGEDSETKAAYKYPYGKNGKVYYRALTAIRQRAGQQGAKAVFEAAGRLIDACPGEEGKGDSGEKQEESRLGGSPRFEIVARDNKAAEIYLYTSVGERYFNGISSNTFQKELAKLGKVNNLTVYIDSDGGSVFDGITIYNQLVRHPAYVTTVIDGLAASIASIIACAGSTVKMSSNGMFVIHEPWAGVTGTSTEMRREADALDKIKENMINIYASKTKYLPEKIRPMLADETWLQAHEALSHGFVDEIIPGALQAACLHYDLSRFKHAPSWYGRAKVEMPKVLHYRHKHGQLFHVVKEENPNG